MVLLDDIGSFPLPKGTTREKFAQIYPLAVSSLVKGMDLTRDMALHEGFYRPVASSLKYKVDAGLDAVNYPQHYDMHRQFLDIIEQFPKEPFLVEKQYAIIPELFVARREAEQYYRESGRKLSLKVCVTGPVELYLKTGFGYNVYEEVLMNLARSVNLFLRNALVESKYLEVATLAIDEPSLGFVDLMNIEKDGLIKALEVAAEGLGPRVQIHLHTLKAADLPLEAEGIAVINGEFAATPKNMELISRKELEAHDKFLRAGISRTNIDTIIGEFMEREAEHADPREPGPDDLVDEVAVMRSRYKRALELFGDRLLFVGPDCGLGSWPNQEAAYLLLRRTVKAVREL
ncbi:MAG: hypothetical protein AABX40_00485 [Candidatus Hydrothermarchaeota archaeon]